MKHLKQYEILTLNRKEKLQKINTPQLYKKYIVCDFNPYTDNTDNVSSGYYIFEILPNPTETKLSYIKFFYIDKNTQELIETNSKSSYTNYKNIFNIIYHSNSLKKAVEHLETTLSTDKYNL